MFVDHVTVRQAGPELSRARRILAGYVCGTITAAQLRAKIARRLEATTEDDTHG